MLIRSQDRSIIANLNVLTALYSTNKNTIIGSGNGYELFLGQYKDQDKTVKILDNIQNYYQYYKECESTGVGFEHPEYVFQMPEN